jgi:hypothetical protein
MFQTKRMIFMLRVMLSATIKPCGMMITEEAAITMFHRKE